MKAANAATFGLILFVAGFITGMMTYQRFRPYVQIPVVEVRQDTVLIRDTVRVAIPAPHEMGPIRTDTIRLEISPVDSIKIGGGSKTPADTGTRDTWPRLRPDGSITIPVVQREYHTDEYRAIVEGWDPRLVSMEVYPVRTTITRTETITRRPWLAVTVGPSVAYNGKTVAPAIGATVGVVLWSK